MSNEQATQKSIYLQGHTCKENAFEVKGYPWGWELKTSRFYWIETKPGKGDRFCYYTINPKNGRVCAPKFSTYAAFMYMYNDEQGHVVHGIVDAHNLETFIARFEFIVTKLDLLYITEVQRTNLRVNYYRPLKAMPFMKLESILLKNRKLLKIGSLAHFATLKPVNLQS